MLRAFAGTAYIDSDGTLDISTGGSGGGIVSAGTFIGWGNASITGTIRNPVASANQIKRDANRIVFIMRLGGNVASGGCIYSSSPPTYTQIGGNFIPNGNLRDNSAAHTVIDNTVTRAITVANNWSLTPPTFSSATTNEPAGSINGWINNIIINFNVLSVNIYGGESLSPFLGTSTLIWSAQSYTASNVNGTATILNGYTVNLNENTAGFPSGDTGATPVFTYHNNSNYKIIANQGRVEMADGHNVTAADNCSPVITSVNFGIDDQPGGFDPSPFYNEATGVYTDPAGVTYNMYNPGSTSLLPTQRTYHNTLRLVFSEPINTFGSALVPLDQSSDGYNFLASQRSTVALGNFSTAAGVVTVTGLGSFNGNIIVTAGSNFIQRDTNRVTYIHIAGYYSNLLSEFIGQIENTGVITVPNTTGGPYYFTTIANLNIIDNNSHSLIAKDAGGNANVQIGYTTDWDVHPPQFRYSTFTDPAGLNNGAFIDSNPDRVEFVMTEAIRDPSNLDMNGFTFIFHNKSLAITTPRLFETTVTRLGRFTNNMTAAPLDGDINDQGFSVTFGNQAGDNTLELIDWTYNPSLTGNYISDLRGNRLQNISSMRTSLNMMPPAIKHTRSVVGSFKMYVEFNKPVIQVGAGSVPIDALDFTVGPAAISVSNVYPLSSSLGNTGYIFYLSETLDQNEIVDNTIHCNVNSVQDIFGNVMDNAVNYPLSYIGINFFEDVVIEDNIHNSNGLQTTVFDGSQKIGTEGIKIIARILNVTSFAGYRPVLYYDVLNNESQSKFWYPSENSDARMVSGIDSGNNIWEFQIPSNDPELKSGKKLSFVFRYGTLYCYRSKYPVSNTSKFSPKDAETFMVKLQRILMQNNNISIYNNVIDPRKNQIVKLMYNLDKTGPVSIVVYDINGDTVCVLKHDTVPKGRHFVNWDGRNNNCKIVAKGVYFIRINAPGIFNQIRKVLVIK